MSEPRTDPYEPNIDEETGDFIVDEAYFRAWGRYLLLSVRTHVPATVVTYDPAKQTCTCTVDQLQVIKVRTGVPPVGAVAIDGEGADMNATLAPYQLAEIPVEFPGACGPVTPGSYLSFPILPGTQGMLHVSDRSLAMWLLKGVPVDPIEGVLHGLQDSVFHPGLRSTARAITPATSLDSVVLQGPSMTGVGAAAVGGVKLGAGATDFLALAPKIKSYLLAMLAAGVPTATDGGAGLKSTMTAWLNSPAGSADNLACTTAKAK